jgi:hypothetical protein
MSRLPATAAAGAITKEPATKKFLIFILKGFVLYRAFT